MLIKIKDLQEIKEVLDILCSRKNSPLYKELTINKYRTDKIFKEELNEFNAVRNVLLEKYAEKENGKFKIIKDDNNVSRYCILNKDIYDQEYSNLLDEYLNKEVTIDFRGLNLEDFDKYEEKPEPELLSILIGTVINEI